MFEKAVNRLKTMGLWNLLWISLILSEIFTAAMNTVMALIWWRRIDIDLLIIGSVDAFVVALIVTIILLLIFREMMRSEKHAEEALRESEYRFRLIAETIGEVFWMTDIDIKTMFYISPSYEHVWGRSQQSLYENPKSFIDAVHPQDRERVLDDLKVQEIGQPFDHEYRIIRPDGAIRWIWDRGFPVPTETGRVTRYVGVASDITERKITEMMLNDLTGQQNAVLENALAGIAFLKNRRFIWINSRIEDMFGWQRSEVSGLYTECFYPSRESYEELGGKAYPLLVAGKIYSSERQMKRKDGSLFWCSLSGKAIKPSDPARGSIWVLLDITERKQMEEQLCTLNTELEERVQKRTTELKAMNKSLRQEIVKREAIEQDMLRMQNLESLGILAGGIAHDFNNLLQGIFGFVSLAMVNINNREEALAMLKQAERGLDLSAQLTSQLLTFAKGGKPVKKLIELRPVIENAAKFALSGSRNEYRLDIGESFWAADADEGQIMQVIQNIVINADQAMPSGGTIEISAQNVEAPGEGVPTLLEKGKYVAISIRDTGAGIPDEHLSRIFDPYFTTKKKGGGLGLATAYSIIKNHGGLINVSSQTGKWTIFTVYIPAAKSRVQVAEQPVLIATKKMKVLVMDDEELVRKVARGLILRLGHEVELAANGEEALARYQSAKDSDKPFDVVILDLTIRGGMGGIEALKQLKTTDPGVKAIVSSGYSNDAVLSEYRRHGFITALKKPYTIEQLRAVLNEVLTQSDQ